MLSRLELLLRRILNRLRLERAIPGSLNRLRPIWDFFYFYSSIYVAKSDPVIIYHPSKVGSTSLS